MPAVMVNGARYCYETCGAGEQTIVFGHGFLLNLHMFDAVMRALSEQFRCIAFDWRGQGRSEVTRSV